MTKRMLIDASHAEETRVVVLDGNRLEDFDVEPATRKQIKGNIYLAKVIRVEPSLQAAFVEYGGNRHGFLAFGEIHPDYYQIPVADRQRLLALQAEDAEAADKAEEAEAFETVATELGEPPEAETTLEHQLESAQPLEISSISIVAAPPPDADEPQLADTEGFPPLGESDAEYPAPDTIEPVEPEASDPENFAAEFSPAEPAADSTFDPATDSVSEPASEPAIENNEPDAEYALPEPPPESLGGDGDDAAEARERRQRQRFLRNYKIQDVIHRRQIMLIQVVKEERGNKGAALTTYLSLAGRFSVLMPNSPTGGGVSRKITSVADRRRLKEAMAELDVPQGMGLIVRTAGANRPKPEITRDCEYLLRLWDDIRDRTMESSAPALIYEEASLIKRTIRDVYTRDIDDVFVDGEEGYRAASDFMRMLMPSHAKKVQLWSEGQPLFAKYQVEAQLDAMLNPIVQLRSGGYIVINQTEALVAIDVNSGRSTRERSIEDTAVRTNMEAAEEVARQLRMRDLAGLIVIDFIDMESRKNNGMVERRMKDSLKNDRARIQIGAISHFGLMEMSRQRIRPSLAEASLITCPHCAGMGHVRSPENAALHILRAVEDEGAKFRAAEILVTLPPDVALYLFNHKRDRLSAIEARYAMRVIFAGDATLTAANFRIEKTRAQTAPLPIPPPPPIAAQLPEPMEAAGDADEADEVATAVAGETAEDGEHRRRRRRRRGKRRPEPNAASPEPGAVPAESVPAVEEVSAAADSDTPSEMDLVLAAELGEDSPQAEQSEPALEADAKPRRRRARGGRRRTGTDATEPGHSVTGQEVIYADIADIFEAAERAEAAGRVEAASHVQEPDLAPEHAGTEHVVPDHAAAEHAAPEHAAPEHAAPEHAAHEHVASEQGLEPEIPAMDEAEPELAAASAPLVKPTLIGAEDAPAEKKRGWWRRA